MTAFFEEITWIAQACRQVASAARHFCGHFILDLEICHLKNEVALFSGNLEHHDLLRWVRRAHEGRRPFDDEWHDFVPPSLLQKFQLSTQFAVRAEVHCECLVLAYIDANELEGLYGYIGLSGPSCLPCADLFAIYNKRGREVEIERLSSIFGAHLHDDDDDVDDDAAVVDDGAAVDEDDDAVDDDDTTVDDDAGGDDASVEDVDAPADHEEQDEEVLESALGSELAAVKPWFPIRTRRTDAHVTLPWAPPTMQLDGDGHVSVGLLTALVGELEKAWHIAYYPHPPDRNALTIDFEHGASHGLSVLNRMLNCL